MTRLSAAVCLLAAAALMSGAAPPAGGSLAQRYEQARGALEQQRVRENETRATQTALAKQVEDVRARLIANAERVQDLEAASAATAADIARLTGEAKVLEAEFSRDRDKEARLLAVLQRLDADAPPALAMRPDDSLAAARSKMLLGAMLPPVYDQAKEVGRRLRALNETRAALQAKNKEASAEAKDLGQARADLGKLLDQRSREEGDVAGQLADLHAVTIEAARQTIDLKALIDKIAMLRAEGDPAGMVVVTPQAGGTVTLRKGALLHPVVGTRTSGDPAGPGKTPGNNGPQGLWYETKALAQAVAPADSEVLFAGAYQRFGQVLLLEIPGGYHLLLAGLGRIDVRTGDKVLAGEPVGILPDSVPARLYLELRKGGQTIDPQPWMSAELRKAKG